jgi:hypothetical protein
MNNPPPRFKLFHWLCLIGMFGSLLVWMLPVSLKPYHISRALDDYKIELVEQVSEWGLDADGLVKVRVSRQFSGGTRAAINQIRRNWHAVESQSKKRWPTDGKRLHYDEWGPSNWTRADGVHEIEVGAVYCLPYSLIAMTCSLPLIWWATGCAYAWLRREKKLEPQMNTDEHR